MLASFDDVSKIITGEHVSCNVETLHVITNLNPNPYANTS